jgi:hypothetical protein
VSGQFHWCYNNKIRESSHKQTTDGLASHLWSQQCYSPNPIQRCSRQSPLLSLQALPPKAVTRRPKHKSLCHPIYAPPHVTVKLLSYSLHSSQSASQLASTSPMASSKRITLLRLKLFSPRPLPLVPSRLSWEPLAQDSLGGEVSSSIQS